MTADDRIALIERYAATLAAQIQSFHARLLELEGQRDALAAECDRLRERLMEQAA